MQAATLELSLKPLTNGLSARPTGGEPAFHYRLNSGEKSFDKITIINDSSRAQSITLYPVDATSTSSGGLAMRNQSELRTDIGAWIVLSTSHLTLQPHQHHDISFTIQVPSSVYTGEHLGGIIMQPDSAKSEGPNSNLGLTVTTRLGIRVYETVPGKPKPELRISNLHLITSKQPTICFTLRNSGNTIITPTGQTIIEDTWGRSIEYISSPSIVILPGKSIDIHEEGHKHPMIVGLYRTQVRIRYNHMTLLADGSTLWINYLWVCAIVAALAAIVLCRLTKLWPFNK
jgi:hypothetical protein